MQQLQALPLESTKRALSEEEMILYQNFELYAYAVFESLQVANQAATMIKEPLFCAPEATFRFRNEGDIARLADYVTSELFALTEEIEARSAVTTTGRRARCCCSGCGTAFPAPMPGRVWPSASAVAAAGTPGRSPARSSLEPRARVLYRQAPAMRVPGTRDAGRPPIAAASWPCRPPVPRLDR